MSMNREWLTTNEAAEYLRLHFTTLYKWRREGVGPKYYGTDKRIRYRKQDLDDWMMSDGKDNQPNKEDSDNE